MTQTGSHAALRTILGILAVVLTAGGVVLLFATSWLVSMIPAQPQFAVSTLTIIFLKALGAIGFMFAYLLFTASRDPVRYVAIVDAFAGLLLLGAALDVWAVNTLNFGSIYPGHLIWLRVAVRIALAIVLIALRPRASAPTPRV
jgi:hypothetical protein